MKAVDNPNSHTTANCNIFLLLCFYVFGILSIPSNFIFLFLRQAKFSIFINLKEILISILDSTRSKIIVEKPIVEIGGDEMSKVIFDKVKKKLIIPFVNLERDYYDCSLKNRWVPTLYIKIKFYLNFYT